MAGGPLVRAALQLAATGEERGHDLGHHAALVLEIRHAGRHLGSIVWGVGGGGARARGVDKQRTNLV